MRQVIDTKSSTFTPSLAPLFAQISDAVVCICVAPELLIFGSGLDRQPQALHDTSTLIPPDPRALLPPWTRFVGRVDSRPMEKVEEK